MSKQLSQLLPRYRTAAHHICQCIYGYGSPVTMEEGIAIHGYKGRALPTLMRKLYRSAVDNLWLIESDGKYFVSPHVSRYFANFTKPINTHVELVQPRYHPKTLEMKPIPRDARLREISFVTANTILEPKINGAILSVK
jgi:hypothetical protein